MSPLVLAALLAVQVAFASLAIVGKVVLAVVPWPALLLLRTVGGALALGLAALARREPLLPPHTELGRMFLLALLGVIANQGFFLAGLHRTTAVNATVLVATIPLFTALFAVASRREPLRLRFVFGMLLAAVGTALVIRPERFAMGRGHLVGDAFIVINAMAYGAYLALARDAVLRHNASQVICWVFLAGALMALPLGGRALATTAAGYSPRVLVTLAYVVLVPTTFAYAANAWALQRAPASVVSVFVYLQPCIAAAIALTAGAPLARWLAVPVAPESLSARTLAGGLVVLAGVIVATRRSRAPAPAYVNVTPQGTD